MLCGNLPQIPDSSVFISYTSSLSIIRLMSVVWYKIFPCIFVRLFCSVRFIYNSYCLAYVIIEMKKILNLHAIVNMGTKSLLPLWLFSSVNVYGSCYFCRSFAFSRMSASFWIYSSAAPVQIIHNLLVQPAFFPLHGISRHGKQKILHVHYSKTFAFCLKIYIK